jgi:hypothetical protein
MTQLGYTFEILRKLPREEIEKKINYHHSEADGMKAEWRRSLDVLWAQLLIQELTAREQRVQSDLTLVMLAK